jgi:catechol 2,3-dioxygenase-like lactoylglutathione lyase family enzyme
LERGLFVDDGERMLHSLFHVAIKTRDLEVSRRFYVDVLGMTLDARPDIGFPGIWLRSPMPAGTAIFHLYAGDAAREADGSYASGTGVIDHVSITATGFQAHRERLDAHNLRWRANSVRGIGLWQLFVYDPSGVMLELTFSAAAEGTKEPHISRDSQYKATENFFRAEDYRQFCDIP